MLELLASLNRQNIAGIYGLEQADAEQFIVMDLVEGPTLTDRIAESPIPSPKPSRSRSRSLRRWKPLTTLVSFTAT